MKNIVEKYNLGLCVDLEADSVLNTINKIINSDVQFDFSPKDLKDLAWDAQAKKLITLYNETLKQNWLYKVSWLVIFPWQGTTVKMY